MFLNFWNDFLYQPLFNALIWLYNNWTLSNLGWAVVELTVILRIVLLPFTLINERNRVRNAELAEEVARIDKEYHHDQVLRKEQIRQVLKRRKVQPWAKIIVLGIQLLVLVLLYQVFLRGITGDKILKILYPWVDFPGVINTKFFIFDLGHRHDTLAASIPTLWILVETYLEFRRKKKMGVGVTRADLAYFILFPAFVFVALYILPMVKSLFILTSLVFSAIIAEASKVIFRSTPKPAEAKAH